MERKTAVLAVVAPLATLGSGALWYSHMRGYGAVVGVGLLLLAAVILVTLLIVAKRSSPTGESGVFATGLESEAKGNFMNAPGKIEAAGARSKANYNMVVGPGTKLSDIPLHTRTWIDPDGGENA